MRRIEFALATLVVALAFHAQPASAQSRSWCTQPHIGHFGGLDCSYESYAQCRATALGTGLECTANPAPAWRALRQRDQARGRRERNRHNDQGSNYGGSWNYHEY